MYMYMYVHCTSISGISGSVYKHVLFMDEGAMYIPSTVSSSHSAVSVGLLPAPQVVRGYITWAVSDFV